MPSVKIAIIGGGSPYVPGILYSFAHSGATLSGSEIALMDIDPFRLPVMTALGRRMMAETGAGLTVTDTTDLDQALRDATFVLTNFRPGGLEGLRMDEEIPNRYDVLGQETTGPGGTFFALRAIPQALRLCRRMEDICPAAWLINYLNPTNFIADAVRRETDVKCIAICDGGGNYLRYFLPELLGLEQADADTDVADVPSAPSAYIRLRARAAGVNHHSWLMELRIGDEDGYSSLLERVRGAEGKGRSFNRKQHEFGIWFLERYGVWPANLSYLYPYYNYDDALADYRAGRSLYRMFMADLPEHWRNFEAMAKGEIPIYLDPSKHHTDVGHGDLAVQVMLAIAGNASREFHVNVPNAGAIANLPQDAIVEVPALVDASGVTPLCMGDLPKGVVGLVQSLIAWEELTVDAALRGDKNLVLQAILAHPWVRSIQQAEGISNEMFSAHAAHLPQF